MTQFESLQAPHLKKCDWKSINQWSCVFLEKMDNLRESGQGGELVRVRQISRSATENPNRNLATFQLSRPTAMLPTGDMGFQLPV